MEGGPDTEKKEGVETEITNSCSQANARRDDVAIGETKKRAKVLFQDEEEDKRYHAVGNEVGDVRDLVCLAKNVDVLVLHDIRRCFIINCIVIFCW